MQAPSRVVTRRQSQEVALKAADNNAESMEISAQCEKAASSATKPAESSNEVTRAKKPVAGFTRTLISKSETGAHSLARRTERLQLEGSDSLLEDDDMEVRALKATPFQCTVCSADKSLQRTSQCLIQA